MEVHTHTAILMALVLPHNDVHCLIGSSNQLAGLHRETPAVSCTFAAPLLSSLVDLLPVGGGGLWWEGL